MDYREKHIKDYTKEIEQKLKVDKDKIYSIDEINEMLDKHNLKGGIIQFVPEGPHTGQKIIDTLVHMDTVICDAIHKEMGYYGDQSRCDFCNELYSDDELGYAVDENGKYDSDYICIKCRRKNKYRITYSEFRKAFTDEERVKFIEEEAKFGIDYTDYIERLNRRRKKYEAKLEERGN